MTTNGEIFAGSANDRSPQVFFLLQLLHDLAKGIGHLRTHRISELLIIKRDYCNSAIIHEVQVDDGFRIGAYFCLIGDWVCLCF